MRCHIQNHLTMMALFRAALLVALTASHTTAFSVVGKPTTPRGTLRLAAFKRTALAEKDVCTIQILMSDTGGGHRASANALRDAIDILYPNKIECDIVDIYTDYGPFWPFNDYVNGYKIMVRISYAIATEQDQLDFTDGNRW